MYSLNISFAQRGFQITMINLELPRPRQSLDWLLLIYIWQCQDSQDFDRLLLTYIWQGQDRPSIVAECSTAMTNHQLRTMLSSTKLVAKGCPDTEFCTTVRDRSLWCWVSRVGSLDACHHFSSSTLHCPETSSTIV